MTREGPCRRLPNLLQPCRKKCHSEQGEESLHLLGRQMLRSFVVPQGGTPQDDSLVGFKESARLLGSLFRKGLGMRHRNWGRKLSRNTAHRRALLRNLVTSLLLSDGQIKTTVAKAKAARPLAASFLMPGFRRIEGKRQTVLNRLFDDVAPRFSDRPGGYTRIVRIGCRKGDGAELALLQLVGTDIVEKRAEKMAKKVETRRKRTEEAEAQAKKEAEKLPPEEGEKSKS